MCIRDRAITPRVVGQRVGLHPLVILFSVFVAASLFGLPGMIIATPLAASIKIILARWLPIQETDYTAPPSKRKLNIDMAASMSLIGRNLVRLGKDIERVVRVEEQEVADQQELKLDVPEAEGGKLSKPANKESEKDVDTDNA